MKKDLISIKDLSSQEINEVFSLTDKLKKSRDCPRRGLSLGFKNDFSKALKGKTLALIFQKPSNRTRVSFEVGMYQLGGNSIYLSPGEINLGVRESIKDAAKTLSRFIDAIVLRTFEHKDCLEMAKVSDAPVINGLSDFSHPCQALADLYTIKEKFSRPSGIPQKAGKSLKNITLAYVGDGNNVCNSLLFTCAKLGVNMNVGAPKGYEPEETVLKYSQELAGKNGASIKLFNNAFDAVSGADVIYTDVWVSMGQEEEANIRKEIFKDFQVNLDLVKSANKNALIMHCLPAHRGEEITDDVIDSKNSIVFDQAENRLHVEKAVLIKLLGS